MKSVGNRLALFLKDERGGVLILVALLIVALLGMTALVVDVGFLYQARREMVNAADAAALAGAQELYYDDNWAGVEGYAEEFAVNNYDCDSVQVEAEVLDDHTVWVKTGKNVEFTFARILGFTDSDVSATATAVYGSFMTGKVIPFGMSQSLFNNLTIGSEDDFVFFQDHLFGAGNWGWLYFDQTDLPQETLNYLSDGYGVTIGDSVWTNTGANIVAANKKTIGEILEFYRTEQIELWMPLVAYVDDAPAAGKYETTIVGFAVIIITGYNISNPANQTISGKLIKLFDSGYIDINGGGNRFMPSGVALVK